MRKLLMSLTLLGGVAGAGVAAQAAPHAVALAVHSGLPQVETVQYHPDYRYREWRRGVGGGVVQRLGCRPADLGSDQCHLLGGVRGCEPAERHGRARLSL